MSIFNTSQHRWVESSVAIFCGNCQAVKRYKRIFVVADGSYRKPYGDEWTHAHPANCLVAAS